MSGIRLVLLDLDGTVYRRSELCPGAHEALTRIHREGVAIRYLTNNSAAVPLDVNRKLANFGLPSQLDWIYTSGRIAAEFARNQGYSAVAVVGEPGLLRQIEEAGLSIVPLGEPAPALVAGICMSFDYDLLRRAADTVRSGAAFIGCNPDPTYPLENGAFAPGAGSLIAAIEHASGVPALIVGKPQPQMALAACRAAGIEPHECILVGDRLDTDIACGRSAGMSTWLVLTGVTDEIPTGQMGSYDLRGLAEFLTLS